MSVFRPAPAHNPLKAPAVCLCVECSRIMLAKQCTARDSDGRQCGDYHGHRGAHNLIPATVFQIARSRCSDSTPGQDVAS
jgi:hypothetical protein